MKKKIIIANILVILAVGAGTFFGGYKYAEAHSSKLRGNFANLSSSQRAQLGQQFRTGNGGRTGMMGGGLTAGQIISKDSNSITVKLRDGSSKIVFVSDKTAVGKSVSGSLSDLASGQEVTVNGTANSDGSITASLVDIRPASSTPVIITK